ncbi:MAG: carboxypeptidase regulatory-like domain-containing protein [Euryarchaeota archaeon]|nr:carboxypeptidase regulatory-like domain-containing protein [Euryarchaeota archaeon]
MRVPFVVAALFCTGFLAGCVEDAQSTAAGASAGPQVSSGPAEFDDSTGAVEGTVTDAEVVPIAGVQVAILRGGEMPEDLVVLTDEGGHFSISRVPPGDHQIVAQRLGYASTGKRITVEQGAVLTVPLMLEKLAEVGRFEVRDVRRAEVSGVMVKLTPQCMYDLGGQGQPLAKTCQGVRTGCAPSGDYCERHYTSLLEKHQENGNNWTTIVGEVTWAAQTGATGKGFMFDINAPNIPRGQGGSINQGGPYTFFRMQPKPPIIWKIDEALLTQRKIPEADWCCDWFYRLFPGYCDLGSLINNCETTPDYGVAQNNVATVYMTFFFVEPAPPTYTALPDA